MGRRSDARQRILRAGEKLFGQRSYASIGVAEICSEAGVPKGSFYYFFPSKQALALEVVNDHWREQRAAWEAQLSRAAPLAERLRGLFLLTAQVQAEALRGTGSVTGCLFGNLALEASADDQLVRARLREIFDAQVDMIESAITEAGRGEGVGAADFRAAAKSVVAQMEGLVLFAKLYNDPAQLDQLWENSSRLLGLSPARDA